MNRKENPELSPSTEELWYRQGRLRRRTQSWRRNAGWWERRRLWLQRWSGGGVRGGARQGGGMRTKKCHWAQHCGVGDTHGRRGEEKETAKTTLRRNLDAEKSSERIALHIFVYFKVGGTRAHFMLLMGKKNLTKRERLIIQGRKCY